MACEPLIIHHYQPYDLFAIARELSDIRIVEYGQNNDNIIVFEKLSQVLAHIKGRMSDPTVLKRKHLHDEDLTLKYDNYTWHIFGLSEHRTDKLLRGLGLE